MAEGQPDLSAQSDLILAKGSRCALAIRPEKIAISHERPADRANIVVGEILDIAYFGNLSTYHVKLANGYVLKAQVANARRIYRRIYRRISWRSYTWEDQDYLSWRDTAAVLLAG